MNIWLLSAVYACATCTREEVLYPSVYGYFWKLIPCIRFTEPKFLPGIDTFIIYVNYNTAPIIDRHSGRTTTGPKYDVIIIG